MKLDEVVFLDNTTLLGYLAGICILFIISRIFILPIKGICKLILNSILGGIIIFFINYFGGFFNFHIGLNFFTIFFVSILGVPGSILLIIIKFLI